MWLYGIMVLDEGGLFAFIQAGGEGRGGWQLAKLTL